MDDGAMDDVIRVLDRVQLEEAVTALDWRGAGLAIGTADGRRHRWWACACELPGGEHTMGVRSIRMRLDGSIASLDHNGVLLSARLAFDDDRFIAVEDLAGTLVAVGERGVHVGIDDVARPILRLPGTGLAATPLGPRTLAVGGECGVSWVDVTLGVVDGHVSLPPLRTDAEAGIRLSEAQAFVKGDIPSLHDVPKGCRYNTRCPHAHDRCHEERPVLEAADGDHSREHFVACHLWRELEGMPVSFRAK